MRGFMIGLVALTVACAPMTIPAEADQTRAPVAVSPISRCMNMGNALEGPRHEGEWGYTIRREDLVRLKQDGFDTVRIPIRWSSHAGMTPPYTIDTALFERVDEIIRWSGEIGLTIIINVHHYSGLNARPDVHEPRLEGLWDQIAERYAAVPDYLIFETINEPNGAMTVKRTDGLNRRVLARIRQDNPDRWVILGTAGWGHLDGLAKSDPPYDRRAILTYHDYNPFNFTHQGAFWTKPVRPTGVEWGTGEDRARMAAVLDRALVVQAKHGMPVFVGEFGVYEEVPIDQRASWIKALRQGLEARGMGWCHWDFATTLKAYDMENEQWLPEIRDALLGQ